MFYLSLYWDFFFFHRRLCHVKPSILVLRFISAPCAPFSSQRIALLFIFLLILVVYFYLTFCCSFYHYCGYLDFAGLRHILTKVNPLTEVRCNGVVGFGASLFPAPEDHPVTVVYYLSPASAPMHKVLLLSDGSWMPGSTPPGLNKH